MMVVSKVLSRKRALFFIALYFLALLFAYLTIFLSRKGINVFILTLLISTFMLLFFFAYIYLERWSTIPLLKGKSAIRYTMFCHHCGWEWISHTTEKENPKKCPNCSEKSRLELIGWRKVYIQPKASRDLREFFKG